MELVLHLIKYSMYYWNICRDLKVINLLLGLQVLYQTPMLLVSFDSRDDKQHYI